MRIAHYVAYEESHSLFSLSGKIRELTYRLEKTNSNPTLEFMEIKELPNDEPKWQCCLVFFYDLDKWDGCVLPKVID